MMFENSRYLHTPASTRRPDNVLYLHIRERHSFNHRNYIWHEWTQGDTLYGLAYEYYGIAALRWAILDANPQYRTEYDIPFGERIAIPSLEDVLEAVNV